MIILVVVVFPSISLFVSLCSGLAKEMMMRDYILKKEDSHHLLGGWIIKMQ